MAVHRVSPAVTAAVEVCAVHKAIMLRAKALPIGLRCRAAAITAVKWLLLAGYIWDWLLALTLIIINFTIPGEASTTAPLVHCMPARCISNQLLIIWT